MKILWLCNMPSPYRVDFFNELNKSSNIDIFVCFDTLGSINRNKKWFDNKKINFDYKKIKGIKYFKDEIIGMSQIIQILKRKNDHLVVVGNYSTISGITSIFFLKLLNIKFVINADGGFIQSDENKFKFLLKKALISSAYYWLSSGEETTKYLLHYGATKKRIKKYNFSSYYKNEILKKPVPISHKNNIRHKLLMSYKHIVIYVGSVAESKGIDTLLKACHNLNSEIGVYIIGGIPNENLKIIKEKIGNDNVHYIDFISKDLLIDYYKAADLLVFPTKSDVWGLVINEAMSNGLPIITTNKCIAGLELVKDSENGYIIEVGDHENLNKYINLILSSPEMKLSYSHSSLNKIKKYSIEDMANQHINIFREIQGDSIGK